MHIFSVAGGGFGLPETVALAAVAVIGYVFGRGSRQTAPTAEPADQVARAAAIARQLEAVAAALRADLASHRCQVERFKKVVRDTGSLTDAGAWAALREEADRVLEPTLRLVGQVATAYDQFRRQSEALSRFSGGRTDKLTGLGNSRALAELLQVELAGQAATGGHVCVGIFGVQVASDNRDEQQARLIQAAELLRPQLRDDDFLARYGIDELVVVMPHTRLFGASRFGHRARVVFAEAGLTASCGVAQSEPGETGPALLGRADSALYSARAAGAGTQFLHNGQSIRADVAMSAEGAPADAEEPLPPAKSAEGAIADHGAPQEGELALSAD